MSSRVEWPVAEAGEAEAVVKAYLRGLHEPYGGLLLWQQLAQDAHLFRHRAWLPKEELGAQAYAIGQAALCEVLGEAPAPTFPPDAWRLARAWREEENLAVLWGWAEEGHGQGRFALGFGLRLEAGSWRISWTLLEEALGEGSWHQGPARMAGQLFLMPHLQQVAPRSIYDLAWLRTGGLPDLRFHALPEARFGCHGSATCCRQGFTIHLPPEAQAFLDALPWGAEGLEPPPEGHRLPLGPKGLLLKGGEEACRFLTPAGGCRIHAWLGEQPIPVCATYPVEFTEHPDGIDVAVLESCPSARRSQGPLLLEEGRHGDWRHRWSLSRRHALRSYHLAPGQPGTWPEFRAAEAAILDALGRPGGVAERLWWAQQALAEHLGEEALGPKPEASPEHRAVGLAWLWRSLGPLSLDRPAPARLLDPPGRFAEELGGRLRAMCFGKVPYVFEQNLRGALGVVALFGLQALALSAAEPRGELSEAQWTQLLRQFTGIRVWRHVADDEAGEADLARRAGQGSLLRELVGLPEAPPLA